MEVYYNGQWGTICDYRWDLNDAQVLCKQLGFGPAIYARGGAYYGQGSGQIWLDNLNCVGTELTIKDCSHRGWGNEDCSHSEDAGVQCSALDGKFRCNILCVFGVKQYALCSSILQYVYCHIAICN